MAQRVTFDGHTLTGLREWAKTMRADGYPIVGASKMDGGTLLAACRKRCSDVRRDREARNLRPLMGRPFVPGVCLRAECGCLIVATTGILKWQPERPTVGLDDDPSLYVHGNYVSLCAECRANHPAGIEYLNEAATGERGGLPYRFYLHNHKVTDTPDTVETIEHGDLNAGDVVHVYGMRVRLDTVKRYPRGNFEGDTVPCSSWSGAIIGGIHPYGWNERQWTVQSIDRGMWRVRERHA